jgi:hypothetical protein
VTLITIIYRVYYHSLVILLDDLHLGGVVGLGLVFVERPKHAVQFGGRALLLLARLLHDSLNLSFFKRKAYGFIEFFDPPFYL